MLVKRLRKPLALLAAAVTTGALAIPALAATKTVKVADDYFVRAGSRPTVTVKRNDIVKWVWRGDSAHNVVVTKGPVKFRSSTIVRGSYSKRMRKRGSYVIVCTLHSGMDMNLKVR